MSVDYNSIAGRNLNRLASLSDGIFAVAMTLLVLDLKTPAQQAVHSSGGLLLAIVAMSPQFITYVLSFMTLGIFWMGQQSQVNFLTRADHRFTWLHLVFLCAVSFIPFSTRLLAEFLVYRAAVFYYWVNMLILGGLLYASWRYATHAGLLSEEANYELRCAVERRILVAQALYSGAAALAFVDTRLSITVIFLLQLNYVVAPGLPFFSRV